ncbi:MAG TPA: c-type cytochrome, partial [Puia sp.]|nr:c-type cytochrome [Puia sp.]
LQHIMVDEFDDGLGVGCGFCHAKQNGSDRLDYASDAKPEKEIARTMMRLTLKVNRKYFQVSRPLIGDSVLIVTCQTCHRGEAHPAP